MKRPRHPSVQAGFTLIEILIVIGIIAILAAIVLVAINPTKQFAKANNAQRISNINAILNAVGQYTVDNKGTLPTGVPSSAAEIASGSGKADICSALVPTYLPALPADPGKSDQSITSGECNSYSTGYNISKDSNNRVTVTAPSAEDGATISVSR